MVHIPEQNCVESTDHRPIDTENLEPSIACSFQQRITGWSLVFWPVMKLPCIICCVVCTPWELGGDRALTVHNIQRVVGRCREPTGPKSKILPWKPHFCAVWPWQLPSWWSLFCWVPCHQQMKLAPVHWLCIRLFFILLFNLVFTVDLD